MTFSHLMIIYSKYQSYTISVNGDINVAENLKQKMTWDLAY